MAGDIAETTPVGLAEAKAYLRLEDGEEDALIAGLIRTAAGLCEAFTGLVLLTRAASEVLAADGEWRRLGGTPVVGIDGVAALALDGAETGLAAGEWSGDVDGNGDGWVRVRAPEAGRVRVTYRAGMAEDWNGVPEPLRQGMLRLVAHLHAHRDAADDAGPPAAVAALWRPWRRMRLG